MSTTTEATPDTALRWAFLTDRIEQQVQRLNDALGYSTELDADCRRVCVTWGYIGNCDLFGNGHDDRSWSVFLPHPGRAGKAEDRVGGIATNDVDGARIILAQLGAMVRLAEHMRGAA